jgi:hypothetical protein
MKVCPKDSSHRTFRTAAVEHHDWLVDGNGDFLEDLGVYESKLIESAFTCEICGSDAKEIS